MATSKPLIAVVDDDPSVVRSVARLLRSVGYEVSAFSSAQEFLVSLATSLPECLVLDVHMPGMSGLELQSRLLELGHRFPIVFITAHDTPQTWAAASQSSTLGVLIKPFVNNALLDFVRKAVELTPVSAHGP